MQINSFALIQCRTSNDPMRQHEIECFRTALEIDSSQLIPYNMVVDKLDASLLKGVDAVFIGGAGEFSVLQNLPFLNNFFNFLYFIVDNSFPMFASCFGFQGLCLALGGSVISDVNRAEVGTYELTLTPKGKSDHVFGDLPDKFFGQMGHKDSAVSLPSDAVCLASSEKVSYQAFKIKGKPIYATQFHPELTMQQNRERFEHYLKEYSGDKFPLDIIGIRRSFRDSSETYSLMRKFTSKFLI